MEKTKEYIKTYLIDYFTKVSQYYLISHKLYLAINCLSPLRKRDFNKRFSKIETAIKNGEPLDSAIKLFFPATPIQIKKKEYGKIALTGNLDDWDAQSLAKLSYVPSDEEEQESNRFMNPVPDRKLKDVHEVVEFFYRCVIEPSELIKKCKADPDFIFSRSGIYNIRLLRADLYNKDKNKAERAKRTLEAVGKCLALKGWKDKPRKIEKTVLIRERDDILNKINSSEIPSLKDADEKKIVIKKLFGKKVSDKLIVIPIDSKDLANCLAELKYGYSGTGEIVKNYEKDVLRIDCRNGLIAYRLKPAR